MKRTGLVHLIITIWLCVLPAVHSNNPHCSKVVLHAWCSAETTHRSIHTWSSCDYDHIVPFYEKRCRLNDKGHYCGSSFDYYTDIQEANTECLEGDKSMGCSYTCRTKLEVLHEEIGCCINEILNTTKTSWLYPSLFNYTLWESCNLTTPSLSCLPSPLIRSATTEKMNCSREDIFEKTELIACNRSMLQPLLEMYESHDCGAIGEDQLNFCGQDEHGQWCMKRFVLNIQTVLSLIDLITTHCPTTNKCSPDCKMSLRAFRETMGCCITNTLNNTYAELIFAESYEHLRNYTSYDLWKTCGIPHPGHCEVMFSAAVASTEQKPYKVLCATVGVLSLVFTSLLWPQ